MIQLIEESLVRQNKAFLLLFFLLEEEFARLQKSNPQGVSQIELSIQELMRQIAVERASMRRKVMAVQPEATRVHELYPLMDEEQQSAFKEMLAMMDGTEQRCAVQAAKNNELAMALFDQSKKLLNYMHEQIKPKNTTSYGASGKYAQVAPTARLLNGRL